MPQGIADENETKLLSNLVAFARGRAVGTKHPGKRNIREYEKLLHNIKKIVNLVVLEEPLDEQLTSLWLSLAMTIFWLVKIARSKKLQAYGIFGDSREVHLLSIATPETPYGGCVWNRHMASNRLYMVACFQRVSFTTQEIGLAH